MFRHVLEKVNNIYNLNDEIGFCSVLEFIKAERWNWEQSADYEALEDYGIKSFWDYLVYNFQFSSMELDYIKRMCALELVKHYFKNFIFKQELFENDLIILDLVTGTLGHNRRKIFDRWNNDPWKCDPVLDLDELEFQQFVNTYKRVIEEFQ